MTRTNILLSEPQRAWLESEASKLGVTLSELLRRIIDTARAGK